MQATIRMDNEQDLAAIAEKMFQLYVSNRDRFVMMRLDGSIYVPKY